MTAKKALRAQLRAARDGFVAAGTPRLAVPALLRERLVPGAVVASYLPIGSETDPAPLVAAARDAGCVLALPWVVDRATPIHFVRWDAEAAVEAGPFGLRQPAKGEPVAPDVILTPLLGFDSRLNRLGQGAGHYDRAFVAHPRAWRLGLAWSVQQLPALPADPWDVPLHAILTEAALHLPEGH
ncbi:5-formyltetrahydrofolate cyclo-ligase [Sphingomonas sp. ac-8]|uniref:5-formyltetrahydrofolate cyclo-ligase n=1 Tax=Sphingomonas sp. ac-8 TaxID=3242977 RepID=UPI003A813DC0